MCNWNDDEAWFKALTANIGGSMNAEGCNDFELEARFRDAMSYLTNYKGASDNPTGRAFYRQLNFSQWLWEIMKSLDGYATLEIAKMDIDLKSTGAYAGSGIAAARWMPILKTTMLAVILFTIPLILLLMVVPQWGMNAFKFWLGLFFWYGLWHVLDTSMAAAVGKSEINSFYAIWNDIFGAKLGYKFFNMGVPTLRAC